MANKKKTNGKDPAVLLYTQDFIVGTITMTHEQRGKYILLLCLQHQKGKLTLNDLRQVLSDEDTMLTEKFPIHADGFYYNDRMEMEIQNRKIKTDSSRNNGALGGRPKTTILPNDKPNNNPQVISGITQTKPTNNPTGNATGNENEAENKDVVISKHMLERIIDKFISVDNRFKLHSVINEIDEDYGGFDNLLEMYLPNDTSAQNNYKLKLNQYQNGIFK